jgi:hypothetical protein
VYTHYSPITSFCSLLLAVQPLQHHTLKQHGQVHLYSMNRLNAADGPFQSPTTRSMLLSLLELPCLGGNTYVRHTPAHQQRTATSP